MDRLFWALVAAFFFVFAPTLAHADTVHVVQRGEMLGSIAPRYGVTVEQLREWNSLRGDTIYENQELRIRGVREGSRRSSRSSAPPPIPWHEHTVVSGEVVSGIAARYGVSLDDVRRWNPSLNIDRIRPGQVVRLQVAGRASREVRHTVRERETLSAIAVRHNVTVSEIEAWNPRINPNRIRPGQEILLRLRGPEVESESVGSANAGRLVNGEQLPPHPAYRIRDPARAWGTNQTVSSILDAFEHVRRADRSVPILAVHDLSREGGGSLRGHRSHESGRDADIGIYYTGCRSECEYRRVSPDEFDAARMWTLIGYWIERDLVDYIFLDYGLQRPLYDWLRAQGHSEQQLSRWIQYPRGRDRATGLIRHEPNHADHIHVRFSCGASDRRCR
jgi:LysM repeat protein